MISLDPRDICDHTCINTSIILKTIYEEQNGWLSKLPTAIFSIILHLVDEDSFAEDDINGLVGRIMDLRDNKYNIWISINEKHMVKLYDFRVQFTSHGIVDLRVFENEIFRYNIKLGAPTNNKDKSDKIVLFYRKK